MLLKLIGIKNINLDRTDTIKTNGGYNLRVDDSQTYVIKAHLIFYIEISDFYKQKWAFVAVCICKKYRFVYNTHWLWKQCPLATT